MASTKVLCRSFASIRALGSSEKLTDVVAFVTGGASGLGAATVFHLEKRGVRVVAVDLPSQVDKVKENTKELSNNIKYCAADVTQEDSVSKALDFLQDEFGEPANLIVNCAGVAPAVKTYSSRKGPHSLDVFHKTLLINTVGSFNVSRLAAERMMRREQDSDNLRGLIVNTASIAAYEGQIGQVAYAASKGAVVGMTLPMARDLASVGIRVMAIAPGLFTTPMLDGLPEKAKDDLATSVPCPSRLGRPEEFATLVESILCNPMLNGSVIRLDGALRMPP